MLSLSGRFVAVSAVGLTVVTALHGYPPQFDDLKGKYKAWKLQTAIETSTARPVIPEGLKYVQRLSAESDIKRAASSHLRPYSYYVVYGPRGGGKSIVVDHIAKNMEGGTIQISVTSADIVSSLYEKLIGVKDAEQYSTYPTVEPLLDALAKVKCVPTIIFDVNLYRGPQDPEIIYAVRILSEKLSKFCRCIIVFSEASVVSGLFGHCGSPERFFIFVGEMTIPEAKELMSNYQTDTTTFTDEEMQYIFENIGTHPMRLRSLIADVPGEVTLKQFVERVLYRAREDLRLFPHQRILKALKEHPEGVPSEYFNHQMDKGVHLANPNQVEVGLKKNDAVLYRMELDMYQLGSTAHKTALKSYTPTL